MRGRSEREPGREVVTRAKDRGHPCLPCALETAPLLGSTGLKTGARASARQQAPQAVSGAAHPAAGLLRPVPTALCPWRACVCAAHPHPRAWPRGWGSRLCVGKVGLEKQGVPRISFLRTGRGARPGEDQTQRRQAQVWATARVRQGAASPRQAGGRPWTATPTSSWKTNSRPARRAPGGLILGTSCLRRCRGGS